MNVMKLADRGDSRQRHFEKRHARDGVNVFRLEPVRGGVHLLAPRPETVGRVLRTMFSAPANHTLKRVRVCIHQTGQEGAILQANRIRRLAALGDPNDIPASSQTIARSDRNVHST